MAFLKYISDWVRDPRSDRVLVLFGQAGTGKSMTMRSPLYETETMREFRKG